MQKDCKSQRWSEMTPRKQYLLDTLGLTLMWTHRDVIACPGWFKIDKVPALKRGGRLKITSNEEAIYIWCLLRKGKRAFLMECYWIYQEFSIAGPMLMSS